MGEAREEIGEILPLLGGIKGTQQRFVKQLIAQLLLLLLNHLGAGFEQAVHLRK